MDNMCKKNFVSFNMCTGRCQKSCFHLNRCSTVKKKSVGFMDTYVPTCNS